MEDIEVKRIYNCALLDYPEFYILYITTNQR